MNCATTSESKRRVLIVGNGQDSSELLALQAAFRRCDLRMVTDGAAALQVVETFDPDLVLLDMVQGQPRGHGVARDLKNRGCRARIIGIAPTSPKRDTSGDCDIVIGKAVFVAVIDALAQNLGLQESSDLSP